MDLLRMAKWEGEGSLGKEFSFRDARAAQTFFVRLKDFMQLRVGREAALVQPVKGSDGSSLVVKVGDGDLGVALAIDDIAADLQLQG